MAALLAWDERRLPEYQRARAWPLSTRRVAIVVFGAPCLLIHYGRTRRSVRGILLGVGWSLLVLVVTFAIASLLVD